MSESPDRRLTAHTLSATSACIKDRTVRTPPKSSVIRDPSRSKAQSTSVNNKTTVTARRLASRRRSKCKVAHHSPTQHRPLTTSSHDRLRNLR